MPPKGKRVGLGPKKKNQSVEVSLRQAITTTLGGQGNLSTTTTTTTTTNTAAAKFTMAPLVLEGAKMNKLQLNDFMKTHLNEVKLHNIQLNRTGTFTLYAADIKSFNKLLNDLTNALDMNNNKGTKVYVPRSIQKIQDTEKVAFVKSVDLEIPDGRILQAMKDTGLEVTSVSRLTTRDGKQPTRTVKVTFSDVANRNTFTRTGLQVDSMHFPAEAAKQSVKPTQCHLCLKFNHVAKYCKGTQACARCGENHSADKCVITAEAVKCVNCKGNHLATSSDCQHYVEQEKKLRSMVKQYTVQHGHIQTPPAIHDKNEFPLLPQSAVNQSSLDNLIQLLCSKMEKVIEETTSRILQTMSTRIAKIEKALAFNANNTEDMCTTTDSEEECKVVEHIRKSQKQQPQQEEVKHTTSSSIIINTNKKSRPKELFNTAKRQRSPYSSIESVTNTTDDKIINQ
jgi:hypothetical protein